MTNSSPKILFLSNGHGEDAISCQILESYQKIQPDATIEAMPIVGEGNAYRRLNIPLISPTLTMPSGGVFYMNPLFLIKDLIAGLISLTSQQLKALWRESPHYDLIVATGDVVVSAIAFFSRKPFVVFLSGNSSYYEGKLRLGLITWYCLKSPRCLKVFTRDQLTAQDLNQQGLTKAEFMGNPIMDMLSITQKDLKIIPHLPVIALLPGSRLPEAWSNLQLLLGLVKYLDNEKSFLQFYAALVPELLSEIETEGGIDRWEYHKGKLWEFRSSLSDSDDRLNKNYELKIHCYSDAFADILQQADLVIGMTGTAIEQAVGLGKPVITIPGSGPAFTYRFAEAQSRLLGSSIQVIGKKSADFKIITEAAHKIIQTLADRSYLESCKINGLERMGRPGGSDRIAQFLANIS